MNKYFFTFYILLCVSALAYAQPNKWFKKARKSQINIISYDASGQMLHKSNGFYIDNEGTALTDYKSLKGATKAVVVDENGKEWPVISISGASSLYDVVKLKTASHKVNPLQIASIQLQKGETAYIMPHLSSKAAAPTVTSIQKVEQFNEVYAQYTLPTQISALSESCPLINEEGQVIGLMQQSVIANQNCSYAVSARYASELSTSALSATQADYRDILIKKTLPSDAGQAMSFIYLISPRDSSLYLEYIDDYIAAFPEESNGYTLKAETLASTHDYPLAEKTWETAFKQVSNHAEIYYSRARTIYSTIETITQKPEDWNLGRALADINAALALHDEPIYAALKGHILYAQKEYEQACKMFLSVTHTNLHDADYFLYASACQQMLGDTSSVLALQDSAIACYTRPYPTEASAALLMRAQTHLSLKNYRQAVMDLNDYEHLQLHNVNANFYYQREQAEMHCRMYQQALTDIEQAIRLEPKEPLYHAELASLHYRFGDLPAAITSSRTAISLDESFADAYRILGICLRDQGDKEASRQALQQAAALGDKLSEELLSK